MNNEEEIVIDLVEIFRLLKAKALVIIAVTVTCACVGYFYCTNFITPQYQASVNMIVNTRQDTSATVTNDNINSAKNLVDTYAVIIESNTVLNQVIANLGLDMKYKELAEKITVSAVNDTQIMRIAVQDASPSLAGQIVEQIANIAPDVIINAVEAGSCKVVSDVEISDNPVSPSVMKYTAIGGMLGLVLSAGIVIVKELLNNNIVDDDDVARHLDLPLLGVIPYIKEGK